MADYADAFTNNKAIERNNELYDYAAKNADTKVMSSGEIAGVVVGVLALAAIGIIVAAIVIKKINKKKAARQEAQDAAASERELFSEDSKE